MIVKDHTQQSIRITKGSRTITATNVVGSDSMEFEFRSSDTGKRVSICLSNELIDMLSELLDVIQE